MSECESADGLAAQGVAEAWGKVGVTSIISSSRPRRILTFAGMPTGRLKGASQRSISSSISEPLREMMTSPGSKPAFFAGESGFTSIMTGVEDWS